MKFLVSGASGLVGGAVVQAFLDAGHDVARLVRRRISVSENDYFWDPAAGKLDPAALEGVDVIIHLGGDNIAEGRWTPEKKERIRDSRVDSTRLLAETAAKLEHPPKTFLCASAIGFYGDRGNETLDEGSSPGTGFLPEVCQAWEAACQPARDKGVRVVNLRFGMILSPDGGSLAKMLTPFKMGVGGKIGTGEQYYSWVSLLDVVRAMEFILDVPSLEGPVNIVTPNPVTNLKFTKTLGAVLSRPTVLPMPAFAARLAFGEMADGLLLASARVIPDKLRDAAFTFQHDQLGNCLQALLK
ncbi:Epimerase family protein [Symmachiella macrocystis]|uniref:Epimerase family protein n=1 Tax=Symmachiella macrocystis TaxID=2527985 RepID=A0A5C6BPQ2_9PLAN|nr:TIGR01777 family oxidoreductase [Symmachiella macrocystis]TWU13672.1 Epimerase family protein [Symmachiella macrocystis]